MGIFFLSFSLLFFKVEEAKEDQENWHDYFFFFSFPLFKYKASNLLIKNNFEATHINSSTHQVLLIERERERMTCFVPFNSNNLDISLFLFRPTIVQVDDLVHALKHFCLHTLPLGCLRSSIFKSIHGNMLIWYGAWVKRSDEKKEILNAALVSMLSGLSSMGILVDHGFFDAFAGESSSSRTGSNSWSSSAAVFSTGDIVSLSGAVPSAKDDLINLSYACLALFKSCFRKMEGVSAGICLRCEKKPRVVGFYVWKSLYACYNWILNTDHRETMQPYINHLSPNIKYDIFRVVYVSSDDLVNFQLYAPHHMLEYGGKNEVEHGDVMQEM